MHNIITELTFFRIRCDQIYVHKFIQPSTKRFEIKEVLPWPPPSFLPCFFLSFVMCILDMLFVIPDAIRPNFLSINGFVLGA